MNIRQHSLALLTPPLLAWALLVPASLFGQSAPATSSVPSDTSGDKSEVVELNPFEVTTNNKGYLGAESTSGTRYAAPVSEIPFNVQVVTSQQLMDYQIFDLAGQTAFQYTGSFSNAFPQSSTGVIGENGTIFAIEKGVRNVVYPVWQIHNRKFLPGLTEVLKVFRERGESGIGIAIYFLAESDEMGGKRPLDLLRANEVAAVLEHAHRYGGIGA